MRKPLKQSWEDVENYLPDIDHPALNTLRDSLGKTISVRVQLQKVGAKMLDAQVNLAPSPDYLQTAALAILLKKLETYGLNPEWDAVSFQEDGTMAAPKSAYPMIEPHLRWMEFGVTQNIADCIDALDNLSRKMEAESPEEFADRFPKDFAAIIIGATATVISEDMERLIKMKKRWLKFPLIDFQGKKLEL